MVALQSSGSFGFFRSQNRTSASVAAYRQIIAVTTQNGRATMATETNLQWLPIFVLNALYNSRSSLPPCQNSGYAAVALLISLGVACILRACSRGGDCRLLGIRPRSVFGRSPNVGCRPLLRPAIGLILSTFRDFRAFPAVF